MLCCAARLCEERRVDDQPAWADFELSDPIGGTELLDRLAHETLDTVVPPEACGVYLWCRRVSPRPNDLPSADAFFESLLRSFGRPLGTARAAIRHLGWMELSLGAGDLRKTKREHLQDWLRSRNNREALRSILRAVDYSSVLYVGETDDLLVRIQQHLNWQTEFSQRIRTWGYDWSDLGLRFARMPGTSFDVRLAVERLLALALIAPGTERAG